MSFTRNGLSIPAEGLKGIRKIAGIEWPSKQNYPDDPVIRSKNTVHHKNIRRAEKVLSIDIYRALEALLEKRIRGLNAQNLNAFRWNRAEPLE